MTRAQILAIGGAGAGLLSKRYAIRRLTVGLLFASALMVWLFGHGQASLLQMSVVCTLTGICTGGGGAGIYAVIARSYPANIRASGTGFVIGMGRGGTALAPIIAGSLFSIGYSLQVVALFMGCGSLIAGGLLAILSRSTRIRTAQTAAHTPSG